MLKLNSKLLAGVALSGLLTACSNASNIAAPPPVATPGPAASPMPLQNQLGAAFMALFGASADVEATEPPAGAAGTPDLEREAIDG